LLFLPTRLRIYGRNIMERLKYFFKTTFIGGFLVVLPVIVLIFILNWMIELVVDIIEPMTLIVISTSKLNYILASLISVFIIFFVFFIVGLLVRTRIGSFSYNFFEENLLKRMPFYKVIKETIIQLFGTQKNLFKSAALVDLFGTGNLVTAFITDEHDNGMYTVFVPSGPAPTAGFVYHIKPEFVQKIDYPLDQSMRTIISLGVGSKDIIKKLKTK
jgi:uncharacterized membrane protein